MAQAGLEAPGDQERFIALVAGSCSFDHSANQALKTVPLRQISVREFTAKDVLRDIGRKVAVLLVSGGVTDSTAGLKPAVEICEAGHDQGIPHIHLTTSMHISDEHRQKLVAAGVVLRERKLSCGSEDTQALIEYLRGVFATQSGAV